MRAEDIAAKAASLVSGDRERTHGNKQTNFENIAVLWNAWHKINLGLAGQLKGSDVAELMVLLKIARMSSGEYNPDDAIDAAGYASIAGELSAPVEAGPDWEEATLILYCPHGINKHDLCTVCEARIASLGELSATGGRG